MTVTPHEELLAGLNPAQREAVLHVDGPLLVVAGAGSGKTRVLTHRVAHLIRAHGVKPNEILAITFTNKAATEMRERLERILGRTARAIWILTFHAACGRILRREAERLGYRSSFTIYDQADQVRVVKACLEELGKDPKRFTPRGIHAQISNAKNQLVSPEEYTARVASFWDQTVAEVYELYQRGLAASNAVDFDDMLMLTVDVLERFPEALERWQHAFRHVLVDEYQDTNHAQYRLLQLLAAKHRNVLAVGDPDQSIYAFRGADIRNILDFEEDFGGARHGRARAELPLDERDPRGGERGHRQQPRPEAEAALVGARRRRPGRGRRGRGRARRGALRRRRDRRLVESGYSAAELAVFYRTNAQSRVLEDVLVRQGVPYQVIGGPRFYERAEIKDAVAYLLAAEQPDDAVALMRIANRPRRGIGDTSIQRLVAHASRSASRCGTPWPTPRPPGVATASARAIRGFRTIIESLMSAAQELAVDELVERVLQRSGTLEASRPSGRSRRAAGSRTSRSSSARAQEYRARAEDPTLSGFLEEVQLQSDQDTLGDDTRR